MAARKERLRGAARTGRGLALEVTNAPDWLAAKYHGTDKFTHGYLPYYRQHFRRIRLRRLTVMEIGVGGGDTVPGGSLQLWRDYFPRSTIVGLDIEPKVISFGPRVKFEQADQSSHDDLRAVVEKHGIPDVVIDDGSHVADHVHASFNYLWPLLKPGGVYVIEDLSTSYHPDWGGADPPPAGSAVGLLQTLVSDAQVADPIYGQGNPDFEAPPQSRHDAVAAVHVYPGIAFIFKSA